MDALVLGGENRESNQQWIEQVADVLAPLFNSVTYLTYKHWQGDDIPFDMNHEQRKLRLMADTFQIENRAYIIVAKSVGSVLALREMCDQQIFPFGLVMCGVPYYSPEDSNDKVAKNTAKELPALLATNRTLPTYILQNPDEKFILPCNLERLLEEQNLTNYTVLQGPGGGHQYDVEFLEQSVAIFKERYGV